MCLSHLHRSYATSKKVGDTYIPDETTLLFMAKLVLENFFSEPLRCFFLHIKYGMCSSHIHKSYVYINAFEDIYTVHKCHSLG